MHPPQLPALSRSSHDIIGAIDAGGHLHPIPGSFDMALIDAACRGDVNIVAALLKLDGINPNVEDKSHATPLLRACQGKHVSIVRQLLARDNIHLNTVFTLGGIGVTTPLLAAIESRNMDIINLLLGKYGIDVNLRPEYNIPPLMKAIRSRVPVEVIESLFARDDLDLNIMDNKDDHLLLYSMGARA